MAAHNPWPEAWVGVTKKFAAVGQKAACDN
jgi:hypothetical protein